VVKSRAFAEDVSAIADIPVPPAIIQGIATAGRLHRVLIVTLSWHDPQELAILADAVVQVIETGAASYFTQLSPDSAVVTIIDPPSIARAATPLRQRLDLPLRLILALVVGGAIIFVLEYLDDSIRHRDDLAPLGLPVLAEIPPKGSWWWRMWPRRPAP
jgi:capsular polysaccharide biosynthesis protein